MPILFSALEKALNLPSGLVEVPDFPIVVPEVNTPKPSIRDRRSANPVPASQLEMPITSDELGSGFMCDALRREDHKTEPSRIKRGYVHVSSLINICPRMYVLVAKSGNAPPKPVTSADRLVWAYGRAAEKHIRTSFIKGRAGQGMLGKWRCRCGNMTHEGFWEDRPRSDVGRDIGQKCDSCDFKLYQEDYEEYTLFDRDLHIVGNPDMLFRTRNGGPTHVVEIKSMAGEAFEKLTAPLGDHVLQAFMYHYLAKKAGLNPAQKVIILYASKKYSRQTSVYREYHVDTDSDFYRMSIERATRAAAQIRDAFANDTAPPREYCGAITDKLASGCPAAMDCFNGVK